MGCRRGQRRADHRHSPVDGQQHAEASVLRGAV